MENPRNIVINKYIYIIIIVISLFKHNIISFFLYWLHTTCIDQTFYRLCVVRSRGPCWTMVYLLRFRASADVFGEGDWLKMVSGKVLLLKIEWMLFFKNELWYVVRVVT